MTSERHMVFWYKVKNTEQIQPINKNACKLNGNMLVELGTKWLLKDIHYSEIKMSVTHDSPIHYDMFIVLGYKLVHSEL